MTRQQTSLTHGGSPWGARAWPLVAGTLVPALGLAAGVLAWRTALAVDWRVWQAADLLIIAIGAAGALASARFALDVAIAAVARRRGRAAPAWTGRAARSVAAALVATVLGTGAAHAADEPPSAGWLPTRSSSGTAVAAGWTPATAAPMPARVPATSVAHASPPDGAAAHDDRDDASRSGPAVHVVMRGESLWSITAEALGATASTADIAAAWPVLWEANRDTVGSDPGLIHPGQRLEVPAGLAGDPS